MTGRGKSCCFHGADQPCSDAYYRRPGKPVLELRGPPRHFPVPGSVHAQLFHKAVLIQLLIIIDRLEGRMNLCYAHPLLMIGQI